jgi:hypothetical protein
MDKYGYRFNNEQKAWLFLRFLRSPTGLLILAQGNSDGSEAALGKDVTIIAG